MLFLRLWCLFVSSRARTSSVLLVNKPVTSFIDPGDIKKCMDDDYSTWCVVYGSDTPFFRVDLQELYVVREVLVTPCESSPNSSLGITVSVSRDGESFTKCSEDPAGTLAFPVQEVSVRYVKVWADGRFSFCVTELDVDALRIVSDFKGILKNKPINSSSTAEGYPSNNCNDGDFETFCMLNKVSSPYFIVELQDLYNLKAVFVTSKNDQWSGYKIIKPTISFVCFSTPGPFASISLSGKTVEVSLDGVTYSECGQWPLQGLTGLSSSGGDWFSLEFLCPETGPVRYVKIWQNFGLGSFGFREIDADGIRLPLTDSSGLLRNKQANYSGTSPNYPIKNCIDGNYSTWCVVTGSGNPYFRVDLQELYVVSKVLVTPCENTSLEVTIGVSKTDDNFIECEPDPMNKFFATLEFTCLSSPASRYVKLWGKKGEHLCVLELDAHAVRVVTSDFKGLLKNKPVNTTGASYQHPIQHCNDGNFGSFCALNKLNWPFISVDLMELYIVKAVLVTSQNDAWCKSLCGAHIGVSRDGVTYNECGQWPFHALEGLSIGGRDWFTLEFLCPEIGPVRYVKIWHSCLGSFGLREIDADGTKLLPAVLPQCLRSGNQSPGCKRFIWNTFISFVASQYWHRHPSRRVINSTSASATSLVNCAQLCMASFCRVFSFNPHQRPSCLLAGNQFEVAELKCLQDENCLTVRHKIWNSWALVYIRRS